METVPTYLVLGKSGSGKSFLAERLCGDFGPSRVVLVNNRKRTDFGSRFLKGVQIDELEWAAVPLKEERRVCYVLEDIVALKGEAKDKTHELLNVTSRAYDCPVILIAHSIHGTGIFGALSYVNNIVLTRDRVNKRALKILLRHYYFEDPEKTEAKFDRLEPRTYLALRPSEMETSVIGADGEETSSPDDDAGGEGVTREELLAHFASTRPPLAEFLAGVLPAGSIRKPDLSVHCSKRGGGIVKVSIIDYISCLQDASARPDKEVCGLHRLLCRRICFPTSLVANVVLAKMTREEKKRKIQE